jgi:hypothetical protein
MKKIGDLMREMGFNSQGSTETQVAFIKYLSRVSGQKARPLLELESDEPDQWEVRKLEPLPEQLSFNFDDETKVG